MSTLIVLSLVLGLTAVSIIVWALSLRLGLRWAKVRDVSTRRVAIATGLIVVLQTAFIIVDYFASPTHPVRALILGIVEIVAGILIPCIVINRVFKASFFRSLQAWLPTLIGPLVVMFPILYLVVVPFVVEPFVISANSMAPTLLGNHWQGTCEECGNPAFCSPLPGQNASDIRRHSPEFKLQMICRDNFHVTQPTDIGDEEFSGDRVVVAKFFEPRRWDLVVFRFPEDPSTFQIKRLVGLPGEEITIKDGRVWADGKALTPPESIRGIEYLSEMSDVSGLFGERKTWGSPQSPAKLSDDEYFVLGDFSVQSKDSRLWAHGATGHHPFAVPKSYLHGVVTHTYWPPSRWRIFR